MWRYGMGQPLHLIVAEAEQRRTTARNERRMPRARRRAVVTLKRRGEERVPADDDINDDWKAHVANDVT
jgi:hypothetical protein